LIPLAASPSAIGNGMIRFSTNAAAGFVHKHAANSSLVTAQDHERSGLALNTA